MAAVAFLSVIMSDALDGTDAVAFQSAERSDTRTRGGRVAEYAGGRTAIVSRPLRSQTFGLTAMRVPASTLLWLEGHAGRLVLARDHRGRKLYGTYFGLTVTDVKARPALVNVSFVVQQVTFSEAV